MSIIVEKSELRNRLFNKLLENKEGYSLSEIHEKTDMIVPIYGNFKKIMMRDSDTFEIYHKINEVKLINHEGIDYLFIQTSPFSYYIIDIKRKKSLSDKDKNLFDINFFTDNFNARNTQHHYELIYYFVEYAGDIEPLLNYYYENKEIFEISNKNISYTVSENNTNATVFYNVSNGESQLNIASDNQFLYEQLYLNRGLKPSPMQDAVNKIGEARIKEMFELIPSIIIPNENIPKKILQMLEKDQKIKRR